MAAAAFVQHGKKIVAIGRNYAAHIKELSNTTPKEPFFFLKPTSSYVQSGGQVEIPRGVAAHHEVELGLVIGKRGRDLTQANAEEHIAGYALAVDMTARNVQEQVKKRGLPWSTAKGFDTFTPIGQFIPKSDVQDAHDLKLSLKVNGAVKQDGSTADMIARIPRLLEHISSIMTLEEGDLILTGTPAGVGPVNPGDKVECSLTTSAGQELSSLIFTAVARQGGYQFKAE
ncbi:mitochondrial protein [Moniliophthora roreri MCA 2997]|uniref:Mitochondrial protein n=1 Tax=Moniliophthora roreri (strain MCA 2997) TaxID=1381753 RepID=V2Y1X1_MONRO|nr:mitochondrial protein [Moniliophthora roreri MCA 2997]KAI3615276.1 mitochondrial protein [Moniliophthora roreri]